MSKLRKTIPSLILATSLILSGCREVMYSNLAEEDANELLAVLLERNIDAAKVNNGKLGYSVEVDKADFVNALAIAKDHALPKANFQNLGTVFTGQGLISSQTEERTRLAFAISQELSNTLQRIDGVLDARVHVVLSEYDQMSGRTTMPSAAVFIRHTPESPVSNMIVSIKETVARSVPALDISNVSVMDEAYVPNVIAPIAKPERNYAAIALIGIAALIPLIAGLGFLAYFKGYRLNLKRVEDKDASADKEAASDNSVLK